MSSEIPNYIISGSEKVPLCRTKLDSQAIAMCVCWTCEGMHASIWQDNSFIGPSKSLTWLLGASNFCIGLSIDEAIGWRVRIVTCQ